MKRLITFSITEPYLVPIILILLILSFSSPSSSASLPKAQNSIPTAAPRDGGWQDKWDATLAAAKKEGSIVIYGTAGATARKVISEEFYKKFGIRLDWFTARANQVVQKIQAERRGGLYLADILVDCTMSGLNYLKPAGVYKPLEAELILPEVKDTSKWFKGKLWWVDNDHTHLAYAAIAEGGVIINSSLVKSGEMASYRDLLAPKWKGRIVMDNPTTGGGGNTWVTAIADKIMNLEFLRELAKQEPILVQDRRQEVEWVARGKYPLGVGLSIATIHEFKNVGTPIEVIRPKEGVWMTQSTGAVSLLTKGPHPNAARVYLNWLLSREGQSIVTKSEGFQSARIDVPTDFVPSWALRQAEAVYHDTISYEFNMKKKEYLEIAKKIFGSGK